MMKILVSLVTLLSMVPAITFGDDDVHKNKYNGWLNLGFLGFNYGNTRVGLGSVVELSLQRNTSIVSFSVDSYNDEGILACFPLGCSDSHKVNQIDSASILYGKSYKNDQVTITSGLSYLENSSYHVKSKKTEIIGRGYGIPIVVTVRSKHFKYAGSAFQFRGKLSEVQSYVGAYLMFEFGVRR